MRFIRFGVVALLWLGSASCMRAGWDLAANATTDAAVSGSDSSPSTTDLVAGEGTVGSDSGLGGDSGPSIHEVTFSADTPQPFGGAVTTTVALNSGGAVLDREATFITLQTRLPSSSVGMAVTALDDGTLVFAGGSAFPPPANCLDEIVTYDPVADQKGATVGTLPYANQGQGLLAHPDGKLYAMMGYCGFSEADEARVFRIDPATLAPTEIGSFLKPVYFFASGVLPDADGYGRLVVAGGYGSGPQEAAVQAMDPRDGTARVLTAALSSARCLQAGAVVDDVLYVFGGTTQTTCTLPFDLPASPLVDEIVAVALDPERVEVVAEMTPRAASCAVARDDGTVLVAGGVDYVAQSPTFSPVATDELLVFDPGAETIQPHALKLPAPRAGMACARAATGQLVFAGGIDIDGKNVEEILLMEPYADAGELTGPTADAQLAAAHWTGIVVDGDSPGGTGLSISLRIADSPAELQSAGWLPVATAGPLPDNLPRGRYLQWRAQLISSNPMATPLLRSIKLTYTSD